MEPRKKLLIIVISTLVVMGVIILIASLLQNKSTNQFGELIKIQNYSQKVKNISPDMRDAMESYLYNIVTMNSSNNFNAATVSDAYIREDSNTQQYAGLTNVYSGDFIIDIQSIKQSFQVQYSYSKTEGNSNIGGSPVVITCLPVEKLKYGEFKCVDLVSKQSNKTDSILAYLPFQNFSFKINPESTGETLTLHVTLVIPMSDLKGDTASKQRIVAAYKKQVFDWVTSNGFNPSKYTFIYNYDDNGNLIAQPPRGGV